MKKHILFILILAYSNVFTQTDFTIAFGSCNKQEKKNVFWDDILNLKPNVWIWGGDNIYSDGSTMKKLKANYTIQKQLKEYDELTKTTPVIGTWDDHDYGLNDGGTEFKQKKESQQLFLDFLNVPKTSPRRKKEGIYHVREFKTPKGNVKVILLDTRYFRTALTKGENGNRYKPNKFNEGTILGNQQWKWLKDELTNSQADFNIIVSSIQVLSNLHGFEKWANFPHEIIKFFKIIEISKAKNVIILSGDRHISELSKTMIENVKYPIIDFTSSGLTHSYTNFKEEKNPYRDGNVINEKSYGVLKFDFGAKKVTFQMKADDNKILQEFSQVYP